MAQTGARFNGYLKEKEDDMAAMAFRQFETVRNTLLLKTVQ